MTKSNRMKNAPSKTRNKSGGGRNNNPPKTSSRNLSNSKRNSKK
ncbi:hypothetical protein [Olleya sp. R77988]